MSGFVATSATGPQLLTNDGWWPNIDTANLRAAMRLSGNVSNPRLDVAAVNAVLSVNHDLAPLKARYELLGHGDIESVPASEVNGESRLVVLYRRAVYCTAAAELIERYRSYDTTNSGKQATDDGEPAIEDLRRDARWAIRDLLGHTRTTVELI